MSLARQVLDIARLETGESTPEDKAKARAVDRCFSMLSMLDAKTSALLRFNAIVVAVLAYLVVVRNPDPFGDLGVAAKFVIQAIADISWAASVASCGFAFPVIAVDWSIFGGAKPAIDNADLDRLGELVERRSRLYSLAWWFSVAGGLGFAVIIAIDIFI